MASRPAQEGARGGVGGQDEQQHEQGVGDVAAVEEDGDRGGGHDDCGDQPGGGAPDAAHRSVEDEHGEDAFGGLGERDRPDVEAEEPDREGLERRRRRAACPPRRFPRGRRRRRRSCASSRTCCARRRRRRSRDWSLPMPQTYDRAANAATTRRAGRAQAGWSAGERQTCQRRRGGRDVASASTSSRARRLAASASRPRASASWPSGVGAAGGGAGASATSPPAPSPMAARYAPSGARSGCRNRCGAGDSRPLTTRSGHAELLEVRFTSMSDQLDLGGGSQRPRPDRSQSRFLCNGARTLSLACFVIAFAALVIGGGFRRDQYERLSDGARDCGGAVDHLGRARRGVRGVLRRWAHPGRPGLSPGGDRRSEPDCRCVGSAGSKPRKPKRRLAKVPKYEEPNTLPAQGLTGSGGEVFGSRYGHSADHHPRRSLGGSVPGSCGCWG